VFSLLAIADMQHFQSTFQIFLIISYLQPLSVAAFSQKSWVTFYDAFDEQSSTGTGLFLGFYFSGLLLIIVPQLAKCYHFFWCVIVLTKQYVIMSVV
jgi:hypothetical protein